MLDHSASSVSQTREFSRGSTALFFDDTTDTHSSQCSNSLSKNETSAFESKTSTGEAVLGIDETNIQAPALD